MQKYTEIMTIKVSKQQKETLKILASKKIKVSNFVRKAIKEKIIRDQKEILNQLPANECYLCNNSLNL